MLKTNNQYKINLLIIRDTFTDKSTVGELFLNGEFMCDTLENPYINNEKNISCIPEGSYSVRLRTARESATRDYLHLLVKDVPNRDWILFHADWKYKTRYKRLHSSRYRSQTGLC